MSRRSKVPPEFRYIFPDGVIRLIKAFVPKTTPVSPSLQRALESLQKSPKRGTMDLYGLDDFILN